MRLFAWGLAFLGILIAAGVATWFFVLDDKKQTQTSPTVRSVEQSQSTTSAQPRRTQTGTAQPAIRPSTWRVNCTNTQAGLDCRAVQLLFVRRTGQRLLGLAVRMPADSNDPVMLIETPHRTLLPAGISLRFGGDGEKTVRFQNCNRTGCLAVHNVTAEEIASLRRGADLTVAIQDLQGRPVRLVVPAAGFAKAYAKIQ